jgi:hypothetical protein
VREMDQAEGERKEREKEHKCGREMGFMRGKENRERKKRRKKDMSERERTDRCKRRKERERDKGY